MVINTPTSPCKTTELSIPAASQSSTEMMAAGFRVDTMEAHNKLPVLGHSDNLTTRTNFVNRQFNATLRKLEAHGSTFATQRAKGSSGVEVNRTSGCSPLPSHVAQLCQHESVIPQIARCFACGKLKIAEALPEEINVAIKRVKDHRALAKKKNIPISLHLEDLESDSQLTYQSSVEMLRQSVSAGRS